MRFLCSVFVLFLVIAAPVRAASYSFLFEWDGTSLTELSSSPMAGTVLNVGDDFDLTIRAAGDDYWSVSAGEVHKHPLNPMYDNRPGPTTTANAITSFFLGGTQVFQDVELGVIRCCGELGLKKWQFSTDLIFDRYTLDYTLLAFEGAPQVILGSQFWNPTHAIMNYVQPNDERVSTVPLPASAALYGGLVLAGGALSLRRRRRA